VSAEENILPEMADRFGQEDTNEYLVTMKAVRYLLYAWGAFIYSATGTPEEFAFRQQIMKMSDDMRNQPDKAVALVEALAAITISLVGGGTIEEWFESVGIEWMPDKEKEDGIED
jgi:hypothetical protein